MKLLMKYLCLSLSLCFFTQCSDDYLDTRNPGSMDDIFVTSSVSEVQKTLSFCYGVLRQSAIFGTYAYNDPIGSDAEYYCELAASATNSPVARCMPEQCNGINAVSGGFDNFYTVLARAAKIASIIAEKSEYQSAVTANTTNDWTQLYGEAVTLWAFCYFELTKHFGDVPFGYENTKATEIYLTSRFDVYDALIEKLTAVEPLMYPLGQSWVTAEYTSGTFANALIGQIALHAGGYQTLRTDMEGLYGDVSFTVKSEDSKFRCRYARRTDYLEYYRIAETHFAKVLGDAAGSAQLVTVDDLGNNNPFQRHFQYLHNLTDGKLSPESLFELGTIQGNTPNSTTNEYGYAFGRPSSGGNNAAPNKVYAAIRVNPVFYYEWDPADKRRDVSVVATGSDGAGNEILIPFTGGNMSAGGGLSINKWDINRMNPIYVTAQRQNGINYAIMRLADVILMQAEVKAELDKPGEAYPLINQIRERAYGDQSHNIYSGSGEALKDIIWEERKYELLGEGMIRWDMIRSGKFTERVMAARQKMTDMATGIDASGKYVFANGHEIADYIFVKRVNRGSNTLTFQSADPNDPVLFPGWRGIYDFAGNTSVAVNGTDHNLAIKGLFSRIEEGSEEVKDYEKKNWGVDLVANINAYNYVMCGGIETENTTPRLYWPIPLSTVTYSNGTITNGYGLPNQ